MKGLKKITVAVVLRLAAVVLASVILVAAGTAHGRDSGSRRAANSNEAAAIARDISGGRVLSVEGGKGGYRVKVLEKNGRVRTLHVKGKGRK